MPPNSKKSDLDRRLKDLEKESARIESDLRSLQRALKRKSPRVPDLKSRSGGGVAARPGAPGTPEPAGPSPEKPSVQPSGGNAERPRPLAPSGGLSSYLASGSFGGPGLAGPTREVQRNKALFMVIVVIVVGFTLYKLVF